jgi:DNA modification methylase
VQSNSDAQTNVILAELDNKIQFVYEVAFAKRELTGLGANVTTKLEDTIKFELRQPSNIDELVKRLAHFRSGGDKKTEYTKLVALNKKGSDNQYLTHWYYPYKGKYHPRLVRSIFNIIHLKYGQKVLDPFLGSGTTALESHLFGLDFIGFDISPVCVLTSKVKVTAGEIAGQLPLFKKEAIKAMKQDVLKNAKETKKYAKLVDDDGSSAYQDFLGKIDDERIRNFYQLAQLIFASDRGRRSRDFEAFEKNIDNMIASALNLADAEKMLKNDRKLYEGRINKGDARNLKSVRNESVDAIITSPPYSIALNYMFNDRHALEELGVDIADLSSNVIGVAGKGAQKIKQYEKDMEAAYSEMYRVLKKGRQCVIVIGEAKVDGEQTQTVEDSIKYCESIGFRLKDNLPKIIFGLYNTIKDERVLFFEK